MWRKGIHYRPVAFGVVGIIWLYVILFVGIGAGVNRKKNDLYDAPTPVSSSVILTTSSYLIFTITSL